MHRIARYAALAAIVGLLAMVMAVGWTAPAEAAPAAPETPASVEAPVHLPWANFTYDVCAYTKVTKMNLGSAWYIHTSDIQTVHYGTAHIVYCAARASWLGTSANSVCWAIHYEESRLIDTWTAPRFGCN